MIRGWRHANPWRPATSKPRSADESRSHRSCTVKNLVPKHCQLSRPVPNGPRIISRQPSHAGRSLSATLAEKPVSGQWDPRSNRRWPTACEAHLRKLTSAVIRSVVNHDESAEIAARSPTPSRARNRVPLVAARPAWGARISPIMLERAPRGLHAMSATVIPRACTTPNTTSTTRPSPTDAASSRELSGTTHARRLRGAGVF